MDAGIIIVGGGMAGLLLAQRLARREMPVTVVDKNPVFGGYNGRLLNSVEQMPLTCYKALGLEPTSSLTGSLTENGIWSTASAPRRMTVCDHLLLAREDLALPGNLADFLHLLGSRFPHQQTALQQFGSTLQQVYDAIQSSSGIASPPARAKALVFLKTLGRRRYREFLDELFTDADLKRILSVRVFSSNNTATTMIAYLAKILIDGLYALPGSGAAISDALIAQLHDSPHCLLRPDCEVVDILFDQGNQASGVRCANGDILRGKVVLNVDPKHVCRDLVQPALVRASIQEAIADHAASLSALSVIYEVSADLGNALARYASTARLFHCEDVDLFALAHAREAGALDLRACKINIDADESGLPVRVYVEIDCALNGADFSGMQGRAHAALQPQRAKLDAVMERVEPGFRDGVRNVHIVTPLDLARMTNSLDGAASGFRDSPDMPNQLDQAMNRHSLLQVGQWSPYGSGLSQLELSAVAAFRALRRPVATAAA